MRIYNDCYELVSEMYRDLYEMGEVVTPHSMQNKVIKGQEEYKALQITNYVYALITLDKSEYLFQFSGEQGRKWADAEFQERIDINLPNPGEAWKLRREVWEEFLNDEGQFDYSYSARLNFNFNLERIIKEIRENPDSRQMWLPIFFPEDVSKMRGSARIPCSLGYYFQVSHSSPKGPALDMIYIQRSADAVTHIGHDIYLAWKMKEYVAEAAGLRPGKLIHNIFNLHAYKKDWDTLSQGIWKQM